MQRLLVVFIAIFLTACASKPPELKHYLLAEPNFSPVSSDLSVQVALGSVRLAEFISGTGLVVETGNAEVTITRQHRWGERLDRQLERQLRQAMSQLYPNAQWVPVASAGNVNNMNYRLDLYVDAFQVSNSNAGRVRVQWFLRTMANDQLMTGIVDLKTPLNGEGYATAVAALSSTWHQVLVTMAEQVQAASYQ